MSRTGYIACTFGPPAALAALAAVQTFITSPGIITDVEFRTALLAAIPAFTVLFSARWVHRGARLLDRDP